MRGFWHLCRSFGLYM